MINTATARVDSVTNDNYLNVWYGKALVGKLWRDAVGMIGFRYENSWVNDGFAISQQLPLVTDEYPPSIGKAHQYFVNLLPEADARMHTVRNLKISNSDFELLKAIGGECAGALSILPIGYKLSDMSNYKKLTSNDLKKIIQRKGQISSFTTDEDRPRLSLAGAQDKCPIFFDGNDYFLPQDATPSTHILKFEITGYKNIPVYEYFLTKLASTVNLPTVDVQLKKNGSNYYLLIKRYDRILNKQVQRLHQEDFCQALGIGYARKYQQEGGPSFQDCYRLTEQVSTQPIIDRENLLKWQIFNVLAGNSDGHAKNLALIYNEKHQAKLAPFYDLVCTRAIERIDSRLALSVAEEFNPNNITLDHWKNFAKRCNVREKYLIKVIKETAEILLESIVTTREEFEATFGTYPALQHIQKVVNKQCKKILTQIP